MGVSSAVTHMFSGKRRRAAIQQTRDRDVQIRLLQGIASTHTSRSSWVKLVQIIHHCKSLTPSTHRSKKTSSFPILLSPIKAASQHTTPAAHLSHITATSHHFSLPAVPHPPKASKSDHSPPKPATMCDVACVAQDAGGLSPAQKNSFIKAFVLCY